MLTFFTEAICICVIKKKQIYLRVAGTAFGDGVTGGMLVLGEGVTGRFTTVGLCLFVLMLCYVCVCVFKVKIYENMHFLVFLTVV